MHERRMRWALLNVSVAYGEEKTAPRGAVRKVEVGARLMDELEDTEESWGDGVRADQCWHVLYLYQC